MSISNLLTSGAQAGADLSITCHNVICDAESVFEAGLQTDTIAEYTAGAGVSIDGVLLKDGQVAGSLPYWRALKTSDTVANASNVSFINYTSASSTGGGSFDLAAGTFTPTITGLYSVSVVYSFNGGAPMAGGAVVLSATHNSPAGARVQYTGDGYIGGQLFPTASGLMWLVAGFPVFAGTYQTIGSPLTISNLEFSGVLVARA
jgi:hypothetical protein